MLEPSLTAARCLCSPISFFMANEEQDVVVVDGLSTYFYQEQQFVRAVEDVSFRIPEGGRFGLAGESGSGKTQTALAIAGLVEGVPGVVEGNLWIGGTNTLAELGTYCTVDRPEGDIRVRKDVQRWQRHREDVMSDLRGTVVSMVFQEPKGSLSPYYTIGEQARETVNAHFGPAAASTYEERVRPLLTQMEFQDPGRILASYPHELSGGQSQRAMLALALLSDPELLIADEPTTLLDAITERRVLELFTSLLEEQDLALLLITHDLGIMTYLVDEVAIMQDGRIVEQGAVSSIMNGTLDDRHSHTRELRQAAERTGVLVYK
jgi:ABC-type dipeptide/oligopeptide/nickel transport system ATPase component